MSTFDTETRIAQKEVLENDMWFEGGIFTRSNSVVRSTTNDIHLFLDRIVPISLFWVQYIQTSELREKSMFDDAEIILHMRSGFTQLTGVSTFAVSCDVAFARQLYVTVCDLQKQFRNQFAQSSCKSEYQHILTNKLIASLRSAGFFLQIPHIGEFFGLNIKNMISYI